MCLIRASDDRVEESLYRNALGGNTTAQIFWLKNRRPDRWRDVQQLQGDVGYYLTSDRPLTEDEWIEQRTKVIEGNAAQCFWLKNRRPSEWRDVQNIEASTAHYILSDKPMTEAQWIAERTKVIEATPMQHKTYSPADTET
jgi:hypothetical protein